MFETSPENSPELAEALASIAAGPSITRVFTFPALRPELSAELREAATRTTAANLAFADVAARLLTLREQAAQICAALDALPAVDSVAVKMRRREIESSLEQIELPLEAAEEEGAPLCEQLFAAASEMAELLAAATLPEVQAQIIRAFDEALAALIPSAEQRAGIARRSLLMGVAHRYWAQFSPTANKPPQLLRPVAAELCRCALELLTGDFKLSVIARDTPSNEAQAQIIQDAFYARRMRVEMEQAEAAAAAEREAEAAEEAAQQEQTEAAEAVA